MATQVGGDIAEPVTGKTVGQNFLGSRQRNAVHVYGGGGPRASPGPSFPGVTHGKGT